MPLRLIALMLLYLLLAGQVDGEEVLAALLCGGLAAALSLALRRIAPHRLRWPRPPARLLLALPLTLLRETALTAAALCRAASGREMRPGKIREIPVAQGNDPGSLTRRGLSILRLSLAPNGYVTDDSAQPGLWPLHQLVPRPVDGDETWPG